VIRPSDCSIISVSCATYVCFNTPAICICVQDLKFLFFLLFLLSRLLILSFIYIFGEIMLVSQWTGGRDVNECGRDLGYDCKVDV
jgi:hypothetical protein